MTNQLFSSSDVALTIAGSDPSGGAGLQADLKTFQQLGVYGMSVVTLLTVQNTCGVSRVELIATDLVSQQLAAVLNDIPPRAIKIGALGSVAIVQAVSQLLQEIEVPIVVDPVLVSKHGHSLASDEVAYAIGKHLLPLATVVTPNRYETERLTGVRLEGDREIAEAADRLRSMGARYSLLKLGGSVGDYQHVLVGSDSQERIDSPRVPNANNTHGTGCILSAAITALLASGHSNIDQCARIAIEQVYRAVALNSQLGHGIHPAETRTIARYL